jgi:biopolymer transport protein ExbD
MPPTRIVIAVLGLALAACGGAERQADPIDFTPVAIGGPASMTSATPASPRRVGEDDVLVITKTSVGLAGAPPVVPLPADASGGIAGEYKRSGPNDLFVTPLATLVEKERSAGKIGDIARIDVDPETPYRVLIEVMFTAGQSEVGAFDLHETAPRARTLVSKLPSISVRGAPPSAALNLAVLIVKDGASIKISAGNMRPGCASIGPGITTPRSPGGALDSVEIRRCAEAVKSADPAFASESSVTIAANPAIPFREVMDVVYALRESSAGAPLFTDVRFAVVR